MTDEQIYCIKCQECCKWIGVFVPRMSDIDAEFYLKRGCKILKVGYGEMQKFLLYVPSTCPNLRPEGCAIYEIRPAVCTEYRGNDPIVEGICQWGKVNDGK